MRSIFGVFTFTLLVALAASPRAFAGVAGVGVAGPAGVARGVAYAPRGLADAAGGAADAAGGVADAAGGVADAAIGVTGLLARSARAWNHADLTTFMRSYEDAPDTVYISSTAVIHGYAAIRAHYAAHYGHSGMGELSFSDLTVRPLGGNYAVAFARWHLALPSGAHPTGLFSLVLHRSAAGWHIIADHSP